MGRKKETIVAALALLLGLLAAGPARAESERDKFDNADTKATKGDVAVMGAVTAFNAYGAFAARNDARQHEGRAKWYMEDVEKHHSRAEDARAGMEELESREVGSLQKNERLGRELEAKRKELKAAEKSMEISLEALLSQEPLRAASLKKHLENAQSRGGASYSDEEWQRLATEIRKIRQAQRAARVPGNLFLDQDLSDIEKLRAEVADASEKLKERELFHEWVMPLSREKRSSLKRQLGEAEGAASKAEAEATRALEKMSNARWWMKLNLFLASVGAAATASDLLHLSGPEEAAPMSGAVVSGRGAPAKRELPPPTAGKAPSSPEPVSTKGL